jgi:hypothetical protein
MEYTKESEPSYQYRLWTGISTIAAALQRKTSLIWGPDLTFYPNMYIVLVGPSGARKSTAMRPAIPMLRELGVKVASDAITSEALIREVSESSDTILGIDGLPYYHCSLTVFSEELTVFLGYNNLSLMANLCDWYDCKEKWVYKTKHQGTDTMTGVWINLLGATTPDLLQSTLPRDAIGGGLTARMILIYEQRKGKSNPYPGITEVDKSLRADLVADLERINALTGEFKVTSKFLDLWVPWYNRQDDNPPFEDDRFAGYIDRRPAHLLKLSMILSASRSSELVIEGSDFNRARSILTEAEIKMKYAFTGIGKSKTADILVRVIQYLSIMKEVTKAELMQRFYYDADVRVMDAIIITLQQMGSIQVGYAGTQQVLKFIKAAGDMGQIGQKEETDGPEA